MYINETLRTPVTKKCDVLVCGGGVAGISAALAAARQRKKVILLEKQFLLGGLGTSGLVTIYLPLCDGMGRQVSFGIAEELLRLSVSMGAEAMYPDNWMDTSDRSRCTSKDKRFEVRYNPQLFAMLTERLLVDAGVEILYGTYAVAVSVHDGRIAAVVTESKSGRQAIAASSVVDATGDCDIAYLASAPTQAFAAGNGLAAWYYYMSSAGYDLRILNRGSIDGSDAEDCERFGGLDGDEVSAFVRKAHVAIVEDVLHKQKNDPAFVPVTLATIPQFRMTRRIVGEYTLDDTEVHTFFADSVGMISDWRKRGPVYEVPFRTLYSKTVKNLITAGRCVSVTDGMWDIMRVIPSCAVTGEAAGIAASMTNDFSALTMAELQTELVKNGVVLHEKDLI